MTTPTSSPTTDNLRHLTPDDIHSLEAAGCSAPDWSRVLVHPSADLACIRRTDFEGDVSLGILQMPDDCISDSTIADSSVGDHPRIRRTGLIRGATIGSGVTVENTGSLTFDAEAACGMGLEVSVLDESGSRPVFIYPGMSAQAAMLMCLRPRWTEGAVHNFISSLPPLPTAVGDGAVIRGAGLIHNVHIGAGALIEGASRLEDGALLNNAPASGRMAYIGHGVDAVGFIIEDGSADAGAIIRHCYVGQGASLDKGFTAHDSLFFANCALENGEACAVLAGPYTVSMHKSSLLIGAAYSFFNAGSGTNASNHMYKIGPVHWGIMERGVKTASGAYIMWGARVGAFSLLMGQHKRHADTSDFPFSYIFGSESGESSVLPARMLTSCGLQRDAQKWPARDKRVKARVPRHDRIVFDPLNPATVGSILRALRLSESLPSEQPGTDVYRFDGFKIKASHLTSGARLYRLALLSYLHGKGAADFRAEAPADTVPEKWTDIAGLPVPDSLLAALDERPYEHTELNPEELFDTFAARYEEAERAWIESFLTPALREEVRLHGEEATAAIESARNADRRDYIDTVAEEAVSFSK